MNNLDIGKRSELSEETEDYRRIKYSLKLALRMLNGRFENLKVFNINSSSMSFDHRFKDKTTLECWVKLDQDLPENYLIANDTPKVFTSGTIIESAEDIEENKKYYFYLFKVAVGKSYCYKRKEG